MVEERVIQVTKMSKDGRTTIPEEIRERFNLKKGSKIVWRDIDGEMVIRKK